MPIVYICLGSNKGDRVGNIQQATRLLSDEQGLVRVIRTSALYETEPYGKKDQPWFINAIIEARTKLSAEDLLAKCQKIEILIGRDRTKEEHWGERIIDVDILFYDNEIIKTEALTIPHPLIQERAFVLVPLLELAPDLMHPQLNKSITQIYDELETVDEVFLYGARM